MNNITIEKHNSGSAYYPFYRQIRVGYSYTHKIPEEEYHNYYADVLTHEHIHYLIHKIFDNVDLSALFDSVQQHFRIECSKHLLKIEYGLAWDTFIRENGLQAFLNHYGITRQKMRIAQIDANNRQG